MQIYQCSECGVPVHDQAGCASQRAVKLCCLCLHYPGWLTDRDLTDLFTPRCNPCTGARLDIPQRFVFRRLRRPKGVW
jgi:hypothetical protein